MGFETTPFTFRAVFHRAFKILLGYICFFLQCFWIHIEVEAPSKFVAWQIVRTSSCIMSTNEREGKTPQMKTCTSL